MSLPVLYSFRRCPYAIRARMALAISRQPVDLREVILQNKPVELLQISPKATVPVLQIPDGSIIDESLDIMLWSLSQNDPQDWLRFQDDKRTAELIQGNDGEFKYWLDRYKYAERYPEQSVLFYRGQAAAFAERLNGILEQQTFLMDTSISLADVAVFPFIRQFAFVDKAWFDQSDWAGLHRWLAFFLGSALFSAVMHKYPAWQPGDVAVSFPPRKN